MEPQRQTPIVVFVICVLALTIVLISDQQPRDSHITASADSETGTGRLFLEVPEEKLLRTEGKWGEIAGQILLDGPIPKLPLLIAAGTRIKDTEICAASDHINESLVVDEDSRGIANCFVFLQNSPESVHPLLTKPVNPVIHPEIRGCTFEPHCTFVQIPQTVEVVNRDPLHHSPHCYALMLRGSGLIRTGGDEYKFRFSRPERIPTPVKCDYHPWMTSYWLVLDHPYAAITDSQGRFRIVGLPEGEHDLVIWHESAGYLKRTHKVNVQGHSISKAQPLKFHSRQFDL